MHPPKPQSRIRRHGLASAVAVLLAAGSGTGALAQLFPIPSQAGPLAQAEPSQPGFATMEIAARIMLDASLDEVEDLLAGSMGALEVNRFDIMGLEVVLVAVPVDDDCLPRGAPLACSSIRVRLVVNDPARGLRVSRVEAFEAIAGPWTVAEMFSHAERRLGPSLEPESWAEQIRGIPRAVWQQRWRPTIRESTAFEVIVTTGQPPDADATPPHSGHPAVGVGFVLRDPAIEDASIRASCRIIQNENGVPCYE
jgi:hypothetical protein